MSDFMHLCCGGDGIPRHHVRRYTDTDATAADGRWLNSTRAEPNHVSGIAPIPSIDGEGQGAIVSLPTFFGSPTWSTTSRLMRLNDVQNVDWMISPGSAYHAMKATADEFVAFAAMNPFSTGNFDRRNFGRVAQWRRNADGALIHQWTAPEFQNAIDADADADLNIAYIFADSFTGDAFARYLTWDGAMATVEWTRKLNDTDPAGNFKPAFGSPIVGAVLIVPEGILVGGEGSNPLLGGDPNRSSLILLDKSTGASIESTPRTDPAGWPGRVWDLAGPSKSDLIVEFGPSTGGFGLVAGSNLAKGTDLPDTKMAWDFVAENDVIWIPRRDITIGPITGNDIGQHDTAGEVWAMPWRTDPATSECPQLNKKPYALAIDDLGRLWIGGESSDD